MTPSDTPIDSDSDTARDVPRVGFVSLGCPKALVDTENIVGELLARGYQSAPDYTDADIVVVNTCGFIESAVEESLAAIEQAMAENGRVVVTGCLGARPERITERFPDVLHVSGPQATAEVAAAVSTWQPLDGVSTQASTEPLMQERALLTPPHYAYLKISEGCNHRCSFCIIPSMRGRLRSRTIDDVLTEADQLAGAGVRELLVISQDTSAYGVDRRYQECSVDGRRLRTDLTTLGRELGERFEWVRLHYVYPYPHVDQLLPLMAEGYLLPYLDVPLQHADPAVLRAMRRPAAGEQALRRIENWRQQVPELKLRSTFIVGFPGETEAQFQALLDFLEAARLDRVGAFAYSNIEGAAAAALPDPVPEALKIERLERLMALQAGISAERLQEWVGLDTRVLVDQIVQGPDGLTAEGRTYGDAPDIDGRVIIHDAAGLAAGEFAWTHIEAAGEHDLTARALGESLNFD